MARIIEASPAARHGAIAQGEVWWTELRDPLLVVVQGDAFNARSKAGLRRPSVANVSQLVTL